MKAGIYKRRDNGRHIYVAKDRSVRAYELAHGAFSRVVSFDWLVSCQQKGEVVSWPASLDDMDMVFADRVADAPNGCKDHARALKDYVARALVAKHGPKDVRLAFPGVLAEEDGEDRARAHLKRLAEHAPDTRTEQPPTDPTLETTDTFAERAAEQLDTVVAYEKAKRDLQVMLLAEQRGIAEWVVDDWAVPAERVTEFYALMNNPPAVLPVLPPGFVEERARSYLGNPRIDKGLKESMALLLDEQRAIIKHLLDEKPNYVFTSGSEDAMPDGNRRYNVVLSKTVNALTKMQKGMRLTAEDWSHVSDDPEERAALAAIARGEIRLIGKKSKRKHKRAGHRVFWCEPMGSWAWEVKS